MTRELDAATESAAQADVARPVLFARLDFSSGLVRVNSTPYTFSFGGEPYVGVGDLGEVSPVEETADVEATTIQLTLSGVKPTHIAIALAEQYQGRDARLYLGFLDESHDLVADPTLIFRGRMDTMPIVLGTEGKVSVTVEGRLADLFRPRVRRWNHEDQQARFPGDRGLEFVERMVSKELVWKPRS